MAEKSKINVGLPPAPLFGCQINWRLECGDLRSWQVLSMLISGKVIRHVAAAPVLLPDAPFARSFAQAVSGAQST